MRMIVAAALAAALLTAAAADDKKDEKKTVDELLKEIEAAAGKKNYAEMIRLAQLAEKKEEEGKAPKNPAIPFALGSAYAAKRDNANAVEAFKKAATLAPDSPVAYDRLGDAYLKNGQAKDAVESFDKALSLTDKKLQDDARANHWRRGLALYYATDYKGKDKDGKEKGNYALGAEQFDAAKGEAREDVENSAWHYLCRIKAGDDKKKARDGFIDTKGKDTRVPMAEIAKLYKGEIKPEDVLKVVDAAKMNEQMLKEVQFYAHLYIALYHESEGDTPKCKESLETAVKYEISHYMWDIAKMHLDKLSKK